MHQLSDLHHSPHDPVVGPRRDGSHLVDVKSRLREQLTKLSAINPVTTLARSRRGDAVEALENRAILSREKESSARDQEGVQPLEKRVLILDVGENLERTHHVEIPSDVDRHDVARHETTGGNPVLSTVDHFVGEVRPDNPPVRDQSLTQPPGSASGIKNRQTLGSSQPTVDNVSLADRHVALGLLAVFCVPRIPELTFFVVHGAFLVTIVPGVRHSGEARADHTPDDFTHRRSSNWTANLTDRPPSMRKGHCVATELQNVALLLQA
jgi:hypothetical protein